jgi:hypothetical protein
MRSFESNQCFPIENFLQKYGARIGHVRREDSYRAAIFKANDFLSIANQMATEPIAIGITFFSMRAFRNRT